MKINKIIIKKALNGFKNMRCPYHRYASYDYCYNYFYKFKNNPKALISNGNIEKSCLYLMSYLASWGMFRGSSFLLKEKNAKFFEKLIHIIIEYKELWEIDVDKYSDKNIQIIRDFYDEVQKNWGKEENVSQILITKILMGVYGCVPAFDQFFITGMRECKYKMGKFENRLKEIKRFYNEYKSTIDSIKIKTLDFLCRGENNKGVYYKKAKIIDMVFWWEGGGKET